MSTKLADYVSDHAIKDLRENRLSGNSLLCELNRPPIIDSLRSRIQAPDIELLQHMAKDKRSGVSALGISLFRKVQHDPDVRRFLFDLWRKDKRYDRRWWVMFRLLDYENLSVKFHQELFQFTTDNWKPWLADQASYFGGAENLLKVLETRLKNPSWKKSRTWERVLSSLGASDDKFLTEFLGWIRTNRLRAPLVEEALAFAAKKRPGAFGIDGVSRLPVAKSTRRK